MTIEELYTRNNIPNVVRLHLLSVAALASEMRKYWVGPSLDWIAITKAALFHNTGGIVEVDLDRKSDVFKDERGDLLYWKEEQKKMIEKYGDTVKMATAKINKNIGLDKYIAAVIAHGVVPNAAAVIASFDLYTKILLYCDVRIMLRDSMSHENVPLDICARVCEELEDQLSQYVYVPIREIVADMSASCRYDLEHLDVKHYKNPSI